MTDNEWIRSLDRHNKDSAKAEMEFWNGLHLSAKSAEKADIAYRLGKKAASEGKTIFECPFDREELKQAWRYGHKSTPDLPT